MLVIASYESLAIARSDADKFNEANNARTSNTNDTTGGNGPIAGVVRGQNAGIILSLKLVRVSYDANTERGRDRRFITARQLLSLLAHLFWILFAPS